MPHSHAPHPTWQPAAAILAWLIPGAGHFILGQRARGIIIGITIASLYLGGLLIGGISSVDRKENYLWYYAQLFTGPVTIGIDYWHQSLKYPAREVLHVSFPQVNQPDYDKLPYVQSVGRVNELGTLFCAVAGLLNLLVIMDVVYFRPPTDEQAPTETDAAVVPGAGRVVTRENAI
ncbi:MAG: DUF6677 family protein [Phycisphaeraceae bacterium]